MRQNVTGSRYMRAGRAISVALVTLLALAAVGTGAGAAVPAVTESVRAYSVLPPGQDGFIHLGQIAGGVTPPHLDDQAGMYAALADDDDVTEDELATYLKPAELVPVGATVREYAPRSDVLVARDAFGVPHVYGDTDSALAYGLGYVTAEDRLWQIDVFRHAGKGNLAEFLGPEFADYDEEWRTLAYTDAELQAMVDSLSDRFGADGQMAEDSWAAFVDGINARIDEVVADAGLLPAEYLVQNLTPEPWDITDSAAVAVLQERQFGLTSGNELENAALLQQLRKVNGRRLGTKIFRDLMPGDEPNSPTTIPAAAGAFPSQDLGPVDPAAVALPDDAAGVLADRDVARAAMTKILDGMGMGGRMSNMIALHGSGSETGNALGIGAPQVGFTVPALLMEVAGQSPSFTFHGAALPGASWLAVLGRGRAHAWSLTTGGSDAVDVRAEKLCERDGSQPTRASTSYLFNGDCIAMTTRTETIAIRGGKPRDVTILRTVHGPVFARGTVKGEPVAFSKEMRFWLKELDVVVSVMKMNKTATDSLAEFSDAVSTFSMSLNSTYEGPDGIGYFHMGTYPLRSAGVDVMLPSWGTGEWEWQGTVPYEDHPKLTNPAAGFFVNWNNQPSAGWDNGDSSHWGPTQRVGLLQRRMRALLADGNKAQLSDLVDVIRTVATQDANAVLLGPKMTRLVRSLDGVPGLVRRTVGDWIRVGGHRRDRDRDDRQDHGPAVAAWDTWYSKLVHRIFDDELAGDYSKVGYPIADDAPNSNGSAYYSDFSNHLWKLFRRSTRAGLARDYCDDRRTDRVESCAYQTKAALRTTVRTLVRRFGRDVAKWRWPADAIEFGAIGAPEVDPIPWQNRGTWNHAVEITSRSAP